MAIGELFLATFITVMFERLASRDFIRLARSAGILSELENLRTKLELIQAVLVDAGQKQITQKSVEVWLNKLQHLAYEIDDVLDDLATEATRRRLKNQESDASSSKVLKFIPTKFNALKYGLKMRIKLDGITNKLLDLVNQKQLLGLNENVERPNRASRVRTEETSLVNESTIIGREGDKGALLGRLLDSESSSSQTPKVNFNVVSIVGLGGIGKTTLAQILYNDEKVKGHFELMAWVCVSDVFDVFNISKAIFKDVGGDDRKFETMNQLQVALAEKLSNKRFLVVLDDVWNENHREWERLRKPFNEGAPGSKVLVTTRKSKVESAMDSVQSYPLNLLSDEEALSLFARHATHEQNIDDVNRKLKLYGDEIVKKCDRLPLALKTLGRVFKGKSDEEWAELLNSQIWNSKNKSEILPALMLSYYDLPSHLKQMFAYCCLFPKDYMFDKDELVVLWMAEGFLYESNGDSLERFGRECFEELVSRSFFRPSVNDESQYTMHDLLNDLATSVSGEFFCMLDEKTDFDDRHKDLDKSHHLSFIRKKFETYKRLKELQRGSRLRTLLATSLESWGGYLISDKVLIELLPKVKFLRVLSLADYNISEVPDTICSLKHLRYLNFSNTRIRCLPEQVGDLHNLQSLLLSGCFNLSSLPASIVKLKNLRHLDISGTPYFKKTPLGIGGLACLQTLSKVVVGGANEFNISDLKDLSHLQGQLSIERLDNVKNAKQAKDAKLQQKKGICGLQMAWSELRNASQNETTAYEVLDGLRPFEKLKSLEILYYTGTRFPSWVGDPSFGGLTKVTLRGCTNCTCLPTLGHLSLLQYLFVESMNGLKSLETEFLGSSNGDAFPKLEVLKFKDMESWEKWSIDIAGAFPCLREIYFINCGKLDVVAIELIPSIQVLHVERCSLMVLRSMVNVTSSIVRLTMKNIRGLTQLPGEVLEHLKKVEYLEIRYCDELTYLFESDAATHDILLRLQMLKVSDCKNLVTLGEKDLQSVKVVRIASCERLTSYNCPNSIERLDIDRCDSLTYLSFPTMDDHPSNLKSLEFGNFDNVEVSWLINNFLSSLESLYIRGRSNLRLFPEGCLVHLTNLQIQYCDNIESIPDNGYGFLPSRCLRYLTICNCKNLKSFPHEHLQSLASLEQMVIHNCPNLDDSFPCGLWPPNLCDLKIGGLKKPISKWGMQNFPTSLVTLWLSGGEDSRVVSFAKAEEDTSSSSSSFLLPSSLTYLYLSCFKELESLSEGLQHLTCLQQLYIFNCPKLRDLPKTLLPSLSGFVSRDCSRELRKKCSRKGKYWPIISQIPYVDMI